MADVYEIVTDKILTQLESGTVPWKKPWVSVKQRGAYSAFTNRSYSVLNQMLLLQHGPGPYGSFNQWSKQGCRIKPKEKGSLIVFWKWPEEEDDASENGKGYNGPILRYYYVFHYTQVEGWEKILSISPTVTYPETESIPKAESLLRRYIEREKIHFEAGIGDIAFYSPATDRIVILHCSG